MVYDPNNPGATWEPWMGGEPRVNIMSNTPPSTQIQPPPPQQPPVIPVPPLPYGGAQGQELSYGSIMSSRPGVGVGPWMLQGGRIASPEDVYNAFMAVGKTQAEAMEAANAQRYAPVQLPQSTPTQYPPQTTVSGTAGLGPMTPTPPPGVGVSGTAGLGAVTPTPIYPPGVSGTGGLGASVGSKSSQWQKDYALALQQPNTSQDIAYRYAEEEEARRNAAAAPKVPPGGEAGGYGASPTDALPNGGYRTVNQNGSYRNQMWQPETSTWTDIGPASQEDILRAQAEAKQYQDIISGTPEKGLTPNERTIVDSYGHIGYWNEQTNKYELPADWMQAPPAAPTELTPNQRTMTDAYGNIAYWDDQAKKFITPVEWGKAPAQGPMSEYEQYQIGLQTKANQIAQQRADIEARLAEGNLTPQDKAQLQQQKDSLDFQYAQLAESQRQAKVGEGLGERKFGAETDYNNRRLAIEQQLANLEAQKAQGNLTPQDLAQINLSQQQLQNQRDQLAEEKRQADANLGLGKDKLAAETDYNNKRLDIDQQLADIERYKASGALTPEVRANLDLQQQRLQFERDQLAQQFKLATGITPYQQGELDLQRKEQEAQNALAQQQMEINKKLAQIEIDKASGKLSPMDLINIEFKKQELELQREALKPTLYPMPTTIGGIPPGGADSTGGGGGGPRDRFGRVANWNQRLGQWDYPPNWDVDPATLASGYVQPMSAYQQAQIDLERQQLGISSQSASMAASAAQAQQALAEQRFREEMALQKQQAEQEQQNYLAKLGAQPVSWIEYAMASKTKPVVQPWMLPLMSEQYGAQTGQVIPQGAAPPPPVAAQGVAPTQPSQWWDTQQQPQTQEQPQMTRMQKIRAGANAMPQGTSWADWMAGRSPITQNANAGAFDPKNMPGLLNPSMQYWSRIGPTAQQEYLGYEQARTGARPEETQWRMWQTAPPSGPALPVRYGR